MSWWRADDKLLTHQKWVAIRAAAGKRTSSARDARALARDAKLVWFVTGVWGAGNNCDGIVPEHAVEQIAVFASLSEDEASDAIAVLVDVELFHSIPRRRGGPGWEIHDWSDYQPSKQQVVRTADREKRRKDLYRTVEGRQLVAAVRRRDGDCCRYCGVHVKWEDRRSAIGGTYDHVDPDGQNALDNLVVACRQCNRAKADRTPDEAGMPLRSPAGTTPDRPDTRDLTGPTRGQTAHESRPDRTRGPGRVGSGRDGSDRDGSDRDGTGLDGYDQVPPIDDSTHGDLPSDDTPDSPEEPTA